MKIINVVGARPNFMKMAPIIEAMDEHSGTFNHILVHTGQHYDEKMNDSFFTDLGLPMPDINLGIGSGSHAEQTAGVMINFEMICKEEKPDLVVVVGDVNSTMACTITAKKLGIKVAHIEAGLRSFDMSMPEEINRLCTDVLCDYLYTTDHVANENLRNEGVNPERIVFVGNVMIDTLFKHLEDAAKLELPILSEINNCDYAVLTLHRPSNVDSRDILFKILETLTRISENLPVIFPVHPRTLKMIKTFGFERYLVTETGVGRIFAVEPFGYLEFLHLNMNAKVILTDSGGIQEEATVLGVPCMTLRTNTERPITCDIGTNVLIGQDMEKLRLEVKQILSNTPRKGEIPPLWDGKAAKRIIKHLLSTVDK